MADRQRILEAFKKVGPAHHRAFTETNGDDPEWPMWYADWLREEISEALDANLTRSELVYLLIGADRTAPDDADWPEFYTDYVIGNV